MTTFPPWPDPNSFRATYLRGRSDVEFGNDYRTREYAVRTANEWDNSMIADDAERFGCRRMKHIVIIHLSSDRKWFFAERTASFPNGFQDTDEHARARLAINERVKARLFGGAR